MHDKIQRTWRHLGGETQQFMAAQELDFPYKFLRKRRVGVSKFSKLLAYFLEKNFGTMGHIFCHAAGPIAEYAGIIPETW